MILQLAARVGLDGEVAGVDISAERQARGPERAARHAASNAEFVHADAQVHDCGAARFDAARSPLAVCASPTRWPLPALRAGHAARNLARRCATNPAEMQASGSRCRGRLGRYRREATWVAIVVSACS